jgi:hypothetical protein
MTKTERILCFIGFHVNNPWRHTPGKTYRNRWFDQFGAWTERCPRCGRWHESTSLTWEMRYLAFVRESQGPKAMQKAEAFFQETYESGVSEGLLRAEDS